MMMLDLSVNDNKWTKLDKSTTASYIIKPIINLVIDAKIEEGDINKMGS